MKFLGGLFVVGAIVAVALYFTGYINLSADVTPQGQTAIDQSIANVKGEIHEVTAP